MIVALWKALRGFGAHRGLFMAAGLSFYLLMCLIPMLFLAVSLLGFVLTSETATQAVLGQISQVIPVYKTELSDVLTRLIATRKLSGLLGTGILLLFSTQLFGALRLVMNEIFGVKRGRGFFRGMLSDVVMLFVMGTLFLASVGIMDLFFWVRTFVLTPSLMPRQWIRWMFVGLSLGLNAGLFFVAYRYFPGRKILAGAALGGALLGAVLWEIAKQLFRWYIITVGVYDQIYGPLGVLVALAMFAYYTGIVLILGAEYGAALEAWRRSRR